MVRLSLNSTQFDFSNKVAIVTGGSTGIGRATAVLFARKGAKAVIGDINSEGAEATKLSAAPSNCTFPRLRRPPNMSRIAAAACDQLRQCRDGSVDDLVRYYSISRLIINRKWMQNCRKARRDREQDNPKHGEPKLSKAMGEHWSDKSPLRQCAPRAGIVRLKIWPESESLVLGIERRDQRTDRQCRVGDAS